MTLRATALIEGNQHSPTRRQAIEQRSPTCERVGHVMQNAQALNDLKARGKTAIQMWEVVAGWPV
jgi:hypothetical protein